MRRTGFLVLALLTLAGCAAVGMAPAGGQNAATPETTGTPDVAPDAAPDSESDSTAAASSSAQDASTAAHSGAAPSDESRGPTLASLSNRLTLIQEQLIQLKAQGAEISQQSETTLARLQMLTGQSANNAAAQDGSDAPVSESAVPAESPQQLASLIDQLSGIANELQLSGVGDSYRIVADYTGSGQWVLVRYDRFSGETWLADQGIWQPLSDPLPLSRSDYDVQLTRADNDIKGYVAARLDKRNGDTWWLKQDAWQKFE